MFFYSFFHVLYIHYNIWIFLIYLLCLYVVQHQCSTGNLVVFKMFDSNKVDWIGFDANRLILHQSEEITQYKVLTQSSSVGVIPVAFFLQILQIMLQNWGFSFFTRWNFYASCPRHLKHRHYVLFLLIFILFIRSLRVSHRHQVQVIKHRPRQIQKAYPGLLEPGHSWSLLLLLQSGNKTFNFNALQNKSTTYLVTKTTDNHLHFPSFCYLLNTHISKEWSISSDKYSSVCSTYLVAFVYLMTQSYCGSSIFTVRKNSE